MWLLKRKVFVFLLLLVCYHGVSCKKSSVKRREKTAAENEMAGINQQQTSIVPEENQDVLKPESSTKHENHAIDHKFEHKLENAPIPCLHAGEQPLKEPKLTPMALDGKFKNATEKSNTQDKDHEDYTVIHHINATHQPVHQTKLEHTLESAPLPCMHSGHNVPRSAPMALETKFKNISEQTDQRDQSNQEFFEHSPNPQRPNASKMISTVNDTNTKPTNLNPQRPNGSKLAFVTNETNAKDVTLQPFHHPGHTQNSFNNTPESYNYYGIDTYGDGYPYGSQQTRGGSKSSQHVGVIPKRNQNAREYYNKVSGFSDTPIIAKQGGLFSQLLGGNSNEKLNTIRYGMGGFSFGGNGYKNVLAGLFLWNIMNGYSSLRYNIYHFYNFPEWMIRDISISYESIIKCPEKASMICNGTQPLCTNENSVFCVSKDAIPCQNHENTCVETTLPFYDTKVESNGSVTLSLPCIANITLAGDDKPKNFHLGDDFMDKTLCVSVVAVPQKPCNTQTQSGDETDCPMKPISSSASTPVN